MRVEQLPQKDCDCALSDDCILTCTLFPPVFPPWASDGTGLDPTYFRYVGHGVSVISDEEKKASDQKNFQFLLENRQRRLQNPDQSFFVPIVE